MKPKEYLGDAVYVQNDGFGLILTTEDGIRVTNEIYLDPSTYQKLINYMNECVANTMYNETRKDAFEQQQP